MTYGEVEPKPEDVPKALEHFVSAVRSRYGARLHGVALFGSRTRGDMRPDSDAEVAVIIDDGDWTFCREKRELADLTFEAFKEWGLAISPWSLSSTQWQHPDKHSNPSLVRSIRKDARFLFEAE